MVAHEAPRDDDAAEFVSRAREDSQEVLALFGAFEEQLPSNSPQHDMVVAAFAYLSRRARHVFPPSLRM
jgi:hypothetical protein